MENLKQHILYELWLVRFRKGDSSALEEIIRHWEKPLFYYIRRLVPTEEDAWDTLQEVWIKTMRQLGGLREARSLPTWLYRIARNTAVSRFREEIHYQGMDHEQENHLRDQPDQDDSLQHWQAMDLHQALQSLSLEHREVITLYFLEDFNIAEIAEITQNAEGTVKSRLYYARLALRRFLEARGEK